MALADEFALAIENKVEAPEQRDQLFDYYKHLKNLNMSDYALVFITPAGRRPTSIPADLAKRLTAAKRLFRLGHAWLVSWLTECRQLCESDKVRHFLADFISHLEVRRRQQSDETETESETEEA